MSSANLNWIANYIWGIADDVLRDLYVRGKNRDVILPMTVLRRLDAVLEDRKQAVLDMQASLDKIGLVDQAVPCSRSMPGRAKAISGAGLLKTTVWRRSSRCRSTCSTTPASRPTCG